MATAELLPPPVEAPAVPVQQRFVIENLEWDQYQAIAEALDETHIRINYDRGKLELMTVSSTHERLKKLVAQFIEILTLELRIRRHSLGSFTLRREELDRGAESDDCYYIEHEPEVRGRDLIDLETDPPPDLGVEIEVSRSVLNRMAIFAALRVPEVWSYNGSRLRVYLLSPSGEYSVSQTSRCFPFLPMNEVEAFLNRRHEMDEISLIEAFRQWVREQSVAGKWLANNDA